MSERQVKNWMHLHIGPVTGIEVGGDDTWIKILLVGDHPRDSYSNKVSRSGTGLMTKRELMKELDDV